jgi:hypothetical protein
VKVPENGYFVDSSYGSGWSCKRGYREVDEVCIVLRLPENAHIDYSGNDWICNQPYRQQGEGCVPP